MGGVADDIRPCPYEPSSYFVREPDGQESTWAVGSRYRLVKVLGQGGFSCVVLAEDTTTGEQVALKRVGDVLYSTENAKRVLREVCIMRRMCHPNVVQLKDVFVRPSQTGRCFFRNGQLVNASLDLYMAMEYMNGGDLFSMRGQMHENEVHSILWQLLSAVQYLHNNNVWHRDLKSANVLVAFEAGCRVVKVADFGSARSAEADTSTASPPPSPAALPAGAAAAAAAGAAAAAAAAAENAGVAAGPVGGGTRSAPASLAQSRRVTSDGAPAASTDPRGNDNGARAAPPPPPRAPAAARLAQELSRQATLATDLIARPAADRAGGGFVAPLTRSVCTPCYRAPEVVMSRGSYSSAMDMWSVGCILGELLQRVIHIGKAVNPNLSVAPVFALLSDTQLRTPNEGEHYGSDGPGNELTQLELDMLFDVIGTPPWAGIERVPMPEWRHYLRKIPARASRLWRRFHAAGDEAVDLLSRLLTFDPTMRSSAEEAMSHEYFLASNFDMQGWFWSGDDAPASARAQQAGAAPKPVPAAAAATAAAAAAAVAASPFGNVNGNGNGNGNGNRNGNGGGRVSPPAAVTASPFGDGNGGASRGGDGVSPPGPPGGPAVKRARVAVDTTTAVTATTTSTANTTTTATTTTTTTTATTAVTVAAAGGRFWEISDPSASLAVLEREMAAAQAASGGTGVHGLACANTAGTDLLREMLERECAMARADADACGAARGTRAESGGGGATSSGGGGAATGGGPAAIAGTSSARRSAPNLERRHERWAHCTQDTGIELDASVIGEARISHHADSAMASVDPEQHLLAGRHGEWGGAFSSMGVVEPGPRWGVSLVPPGDDESTADPKLIAAIRSQHAR